MFGNSLNDSCHSSKYELMRAGCVEFLGSGDGLVLIPTEQKNTCQFNIFHNVQKTFFDFFFFSNIHNSNDLLG